MKRVLIVLLLVGLLTAFVHAQTNPLEGQVNDIENTKDKIENFTSDQQRLNYLGEEWKAKLLENPFILGFDKINRAINPVHFVLFGEDYDLSLIFFFSVLLWVAFFISFRQIMILFSPFSKVTAFVAALLFSIIAAHLGVFAFISDAMFKIVYYKEGIWRTVWEIIAFGLLMIYVFIANKLLRAIKKMRDKKKLEKIAQQTKFDSEMIRGTAESINEGLSG